MNGHYLMDIPIYTCIRQDLWKQLSFVEEEKKKRKVVLLLGLNSRSKNV